MQNLFQDERSPSDIFLLIKGLTQSEKAYYKKMAKRHADQNTALHLQLFKLIERSELQDDCQLCESLKIENKIHFSGIKSYLYKDVLDTLVFQKRIRPNEQVYADALRLLGKNTLEKLNPNGDVTNSQVDAFIEMCQIVQLCDGGAYTNMAITRTDAKGRYRNAPSFNSSFAQPIGLGKRDIKYRESNDTPAPDDLTPKA